MTEPLPTRQPQSGLAPGAPDLLYRATLLLQLLAAAALFRVMGTYRLLDPDEGHFLSAARSVYQGLAPTRDFFYQQMPLFPYPYAASMWLFGYGYEPCLWVSVASGAGLATLVSAWFSRYGGGLLAGWSGWLLVMLNAPLLFWTPTVKNHALPLFFGVLALYAARRPVGTESAARWWGAVAGFAAAWSVGSRLLALPFALLAGVWLLLRAGNPAERRIGRAGLAGFFLGAVPPGLLLGRSLFPDPWVFYFNNIGFHGIRSGNLGTFGSWSSVRAELTEMLLQGQFPALLGLALLVSVWQGWRYCRSGADPEGAPQPWQAKLLADELLPAWLTLAGIGAALFALMPAQTFHQYFLVPLLFFLLAGAPFWHRLLAARRPAAAVTAALLLCLYGGMPCKAGLALFNHREWVYPRLPKEFGLAQVRSLAQTLAAATTADDTVLSTWQGFTFLAGRREFPGNENFNARVIAGQLPAEQLHRLHVATNEELAAAVDSGRPKAIALGFFIGQYREALMETDEGSGRRTLRAGLAKNYRLLRQDGGHSIWLRKEAGAP